MINITKHMALEFIGIVASRLKLTTIEQKVSDVLDERWKTLSIKERKWLNSRGNPFS